MDVNASRTLVTLTSEIVQAHVANNSVSVGEIVSLITSVHGALAGLGQSAAPNIGTELRPAVSLRSSVKSGYLVCLEDGKKLKMLKRHLKSDHGMTPEDYRARWGLADDYPMVASDYAETRRAIAVSGGLGRNKGEKWRRKSAEPSVQTGE